MNEHFNGGDSSIYHAQVLHNFYAFNRQGRDYIANNSSEISDNLNAQF